MVKAENDEVSSSPFTRVFSIAENEQVMNCALGLRDPIDVGSLISSVSGSAIATHPRFTSLLARHPTRWIKPTAPLNIHHHVFIVSTQQTSVDSYLSHLSSSPPMSFNKPLWELHAVLKLNCVVLRVHHAVGDGISLMAMLAACFGGEETRTAGEKRRSGRWRKRGVMGMVRSLCYTAKYEAELFGRILGLLKDDKTVVSGGHGVDRWPREVLSVELRVEDVERVKNTISNATMNDVVMGIISSGLAKYLDIHSPKSMVKGIKVSSLVLANLRRNSGLQDMPNLMKSGSGSGSGSSWGNKFGLFTVPIKCRQEHVHPLQHVTRMKSVMDRKKQSFEAQLLHSSLGSALSVFGPKMGSWFYKRVLHATTFLISNIVGPKEEISIASNPVTYIKLCISSLSQALTLHLVSYNGRAYLQISVAKDIIPDVNFLAKCFEDALLEMKNAANQDPIQ